MESTSRSALFATLAAIATIAGCDSKEPTTGGGTSTVCVLEFSAPSEPELRKALDLTMRSTSPCDSAGLRKTDVQATSVEVVRIEQRGDSFLAELHVHADAD